MALKKYTFELFKVRKFNDHHVDITEELLQEIATSSNSDMKFPVARGHLSAMGWNGDGERGEGYVKNIAYDKENQRLIGDVFLTEDMARNYEEGYFSFWSPGISRDISYNSDENGNITTELHPWEFGHLAMLGATESAFKDLAEVTTQNFSNGNNNDAKADIKGDIAHFRKNNKEYILFSNTIIKPKTDEVSDMEKQEFVKEKENLEKERIAFLKEKEDFERKLTDEAIAYANTRKDGLLNKMAEKGLAGFNEDVEKLFSNSIEKVEGGKVDVNFAEVLEKIINFMKAPVEADTQEFSGEDSGKPKSNDEWLESLKNYGKKNN